ncbi:MAG: FkbM family methyltransferase, partial [Ferruginibacter sp.]
MSNFNEIRNIVASINCHPLGGKHKLKSYYNFAAWQLYCLLNNKPKKVKFLNNTFLMVEKGMAGATGNIYTGLHEFNDMGFLLHFLRKDDLFLDIGANIGSYSILASGQIGCNTISFEPIPSTFNKLKRNISINNLDDKVKAMQVGVGAKKGTLTFTSNLDTINHVNLQAKGEASSDSINVDVV